MRREDAAERVAKLMRLAKSPEPHEAASARKAARKIVREHDLSLEDLSAGKKAYAFESLVGEVARLVPSLQEPLVRELRRKISGLTRARKSRCLEDASKVLEVASLVNGLLSRVGMGSATVAMLQTILDDTLEDHGLEKIAKT